MSQSSHHNHVYFSVDIETDGESFATSSMLSIGVVAMHPVTHENIGEFYRTLKRLPDRQPNNRTMEWWDQFPEQWAETRKGASDPKEVMATLHGWIMGVYTRVRLEMDWQHEPVAIFVADPAVFDFGFVYNYLHMFLGESVFGFSALDLQSYVMALLDSDFRFAGSSKNHLAEWKTQLPHTHHALEDARQQAELYRRIRVWRAGMKFVKKTSPAELDNGEKS